MRAVRPLLSRSVTAFCTNGSEALIDRYSADALQRIWRAELENVVAWRAMRTALADVSVGAFLTGLRRQRGAPMTVTERGRGGRVRAAQRYTGKGN